MRSAWWLAVVVVCALAATACGGGGGGGGKTVSLVIMDQNVLHGLNGEDPAAGQFDAFPERIELIASALADARPDVITLQEVKEPGDATTGYPSGRQVVQDALGGDYKAVYGNFLAEAIDTPGVGQLTLSRLPIVSSENHKVSAIRSVLRVTVQTDIGPVSIYNAHLEGTGAVLETGAPAELEEINAVIDFIKSTRQGPAILAGDLNAQPDDPSIKRLVEAGFIDALATADDATCAKAGDPGCTNSAIPLRDSTSNTADHRIDYIFVLSPGGPSATVREASLWNNTPVDIGGGHTLRPSDHIGVRAVIELEELSK